MKRNPEDTQKGESSFGPPIISPAVQDPAAAKYAAQVTARRAPALPKYTTPVAGGPAPPIPHLGSEAAAGLTMADQAHMQRAASEPRSAPPPSGGIFQGAPNVPPPPSTQPRPAGLGPPQGILPSDLLPEEATRDPQYQEGPGSRYAASQPHLAFKYGVIRGKERIPPQKMTQARPGLKPETLQDLQTLNELASARQKAESSDASVEREAVSGMGGTAARYGQSTEGPETGGKKSVEDHLKKLDDMDFSQLREMMMKDLLNNDEQRNLIESRLAPLDVSELITDGFIKQRVPIIPGKFEPEFQSMRANEDLAIKRLIMSEAKGLEVSDKYLLDKFSIMSVTIGLRSINGNPMPDHCDAQTGKFSDEKFWLKFDKVAAMNFHMLASLGVNYFWFDIRVRKLFVAEKLGNG